MGGPLERIADELGRIRRLMEGQAIAHVQARPADPRRTAVFWVAFVCVAILLWQIVRTGR